MCVEQSYRVRILRIVGGWVEARKRVRGFRLRAMLRVVEGFVVFDFVRRGFKEESCRRMLAHVDSS